MNKKLKNMVGASAISILAATTIPFSNSFAAGNDCFIFNANTKTITGYSFDASCSRDITIPASINGVDVEIIGGSAFLGQGLTSVQFPIDSKVREIHGSAFAGNKLKSFRSPSTLTHIYGNWALSGNPFEEVILNEGLILFGREALTGTNSNFALNGTLNIPSTVTDLQNRFGYEVRRYNIPASVSQATGFYQEGDILYRVQDGKALVKQVTNPDGTHIPNKVTLNGQEYLVDLEGDTNNYSIEGNLRYGLTQASLLKKDYSEEQFNNTKLTVNTTIDPELSARTGFYITDDKLLLKKPKRDDGTFEDYFILSKNLDKNNRPTIQTSYYGLPIKEFSIGAFEGTNFNTEELTIPEGVETIHWRSLNMTNIKTLHLPNSLKSISSQFAQGGIIETITHKGQTNKITNVTLTDYDEGNLRDITFHNGSLYTTLINGTNGELIMIGNPNIKKQEIAEIIDEKKVTTIKDRVFNHQYASESVHIPDNIKELGVSLFYNSGLTTVTGLKGVEHLDDTAFLGGRIREIEIPRGAIKKVSGNAHFVSNSGEKLAGYKVAIVVEDEAEKERLNNIFFTGDRTEETVNAKIFTKEEAKAFDRVPPNFELERGTGVDNNLVKVNWTDYKDEKVLYKVVDKGETCATNKTQAEGLGYSTAIHNIFLKKEDSGKKLCVVGYDSSLNETVKELDLGEVTNDNANIGLKEIGEVKLNGRVKEIGTTKAIVLDNDRVMLFQTVSNETCDVFGTGNNQGCDRPEAEADKTTMRRDENILIYTRSTGELTRVDGVVNNTGIDNIGITQDSIFVHDKEKNRIIAMGGYHYTKANGNADNTAPLLGKVRQYDIATKTWSLLPDISPIGEEGGQAADTVGFLHGREIFYAYHKPEGVSKMHVYNVDTGKVRTLTLSENVPFHSSSQFVINNELYTGGGFTGLIGANSTYSNKFRKIDLSTGKVTNLPDMLSRREDAASVLIGNRMYLIGGAIQKEVDGIQIRETAKDIEYFDLETQTWHKANQELSKEVSYGYPVNLNGEILIIGGILGEGIDVLDNYNTKLFKEVSNSDGTTRKTFVDKLDGTTKKIERHYSQSPKIFAITINNSPVFETADTNTSKNFINGKREISFTFNGAFDDGLENGRPANQKIYGEYSKDGGNTWLRCGNDTFDAGTKITHTCNPVNASDRNYGETFRAGDKVLVRLNDGINQSQPQEVTIKPFDVIINAPETKEIFIGTENVNLLDGITTNDGEGGLKIVGDYDLTKVGTYNVLVEHTDELGVKTTKPMTVVVKEADKTDLIKKLEEAKNETTNPQTISNDDKKKLEDRIKEIEAQDKTNLTPREIGDLVNELTSLIEKLQKDTVAPIINETLGSEKVKATITDENLDNDQIFVYFKGDEANKKPYVNGSDIAITSKDAGKTLVFEATDKHGNKSVKEIPDVWEKVRTKGSGVSSSGAGGYVVNNDPRVSVGGNNGTTNNNGTITPTPTVNNNNTNTNTTPTNNGEGEVRVIIVDQLGNEIQPPIVHKGKIGEEYDLRNVLPQLDGYEVKTTGNLTGVIGENTKAGVVYQRLSDVLFDPVAPMTANETENKGGTKIKLPKTGADENETNSSDEIGEVEVEKGVNKGLIAGIIATIVASLSAVFFFFRRK